MPNSEANVRFGPFDLAQPKSSRAEDFLVADTNASAFARVAKGGWPDDRLVLVGPAASGKTHLASIWAEQSGAALISANEFAGTDFTGIPASEGLALDDADHIASQTELETALLHLINFVAEKGGKLLLTARTPPTRWQLAIPDLRSRLEGAYLARIHEPDDQTLRGVLVKLFADRRVAVPTGVIDYLVPRMERSYAAAARIVGDIDRISLLDGRKISRRLAADVLRGDDR